MLSTLTQVTVRKVHAGWDSQALGQGAVVERLDRCVQAEVRQLRLQAATPICSSCQNTLVSVNSVWHRAARHFGCVHTMRGHAYGWELPPSTVTIRAT